MQTGKVFAALLRVVAIAISAGLSTSVQAVLAPLAAPGTYYFDGVCLDCVLDENQQPIPSPATAMLTVHADAIPFDFSYHSELWDLDTSRPGSTREYAGLGQIDPVRGFADAFIRIQGFGINSLGATYAGWELESFGASGEWLLRGPTEYRTEDFGHTGTWRAASVPEPASFFLIGLGLAGVALLRRRKSILRES